MYKKLDRITVAEAANLLGVKEQAVRKRIQRGTIQYDKDEDGRVYVYVDEPDNGANSEVNGNGTGDNTDTYTLTEALREQIDQLRRDVEDWKEEARRKDTIIMSLTQRIPELEAPRESPQAPETVPDNSEGPIAPVGHGWDSGGRTGAGDGAKALVGPVVGRVRRYSTYGQR